MQPNHGIMWHATSSTILGNIKSRHENDWLSSTTRHLVEERNSLKPWKRDNPANVKHYNYLCREIHRRCKQDKNDYMRGLCERVDRARLQQKTKEVFVVIRKITGKKATRVHTVKDKHAVSLTHQQDKTGGANTSANCTISTLSLTRHCLVNFWYLPSVKIPHIY